jgi:raffinose/stachyose/melibiose transport system substrate-binding protein
MNVALHYEWKDAGVDISDGHTPPAISFAYAENFKQLFDLYLNNSTTDPAALSQLTVEDSMREFALGQVAMVQNGDWSFSQIEHAAARGNILEGGDELAFIPLYLGIPGEEGQGLCIGSENYLCLNIMASDADRRASMDFLVWLYSSEEGIELVRSELGFWAPFTTFAGENARPVNPLGQLVLDWHMRTDVADIPWDFRVMPSQRFKESFGGYLQQYAQGILEWDKLVEQVIDAWDN